MYIQKNILNPFLCIFFTYIIFLGNFLIGCSSNKEENPKQHSTVSTQKKSMDIKEMVLIPSGEFYMGLDEVISEAPFVSARTEGADVKPMHTVFIDDYYIDKYEVTFDKFTKVFPDFIHPYIKNGYPVTDITWFQASKYCKAVGKRLPTEAEWEKAARGKDKRIYTWGNEFDSKKANLGEKLLKAGSFKTDVSPYGVYDMVGNVSEWTDSWYLPYPKSSYKSKEFGQKYKVSRGGSFNDSGHYFLPIFSQITFRYFNPPEEGGMDNGFRCAG